MKRYTLTNGLILPKDYATHQLFTGDVEVVLALDVEILESEKEGQAKAAEYWHDNAKRLQAELKSVREKLVANCEHEWAETLRGPDVAGEHCLICDIDRDYDDSDGYEP